MGALMLVPEKRVGRETRERGEFFFLSFCRFFSGARGHHFFPSRGASSCFLVDLARAKGHAGGGGKVRVAEEVG